MRFYLTLLFLVSSSSLADESVFMVPERAWGFSFESPPLLYHKGQFDGANYQLEASTKIGLTLSLFVEPASGKGSSSQACKEFYWPHAAKNPSIVDDSVKVIAAEAFVAVSYVVRAEHEGNWFIQPNTNYYSYRDGACIDAHISQVFPEGAKIDYANLIRFAETFDYHEGY